MSSYHAMLVETFNTNPDYSPEHSSVPKQPWVIYTSKEKSTDALSVKDLLASMGMESTIHSDGSGQGTYNTLMDGVSTEDRRIHIVYETTRNLGLGADIYYVMEPSIYEMIAERGVPAVCTLAGLKHQIEKIIQIT